MQTGFFGFANSEVPDMNPGRFTVEYHFFNIIKYESVVSEFHNTIASVTYFDIRGMYVVLSNIYLIIHADDQMLVYSIRVGRKEEK